MADKNILVDEQDGVSLITLNRPEVHNAIDVQTWSDIRDAFQGVRTNKAIQVVIITGAGGKAFAAGADIRSLRDRENLSTLESDVQTILNEIENSPKPVIAAVDGYTLGGGCELAMACDIRIATRRAKFGLPELNLGIMPGAGGTQRLQRLVGLAKAKELIFTGDIISADEAHGIGLVNRVVESSDELIPAAREMAAKIQSKGPLAVQLAKMTIGVGANIDIHSGLLFEKVAQTIAFSSEDRIEGTTAFLEKRPATFKGK
jgi:enoyl-CoA hydratase